MRCEIAYIHVFQKLACVSALRMKYHQISHGSKTGYILKEIRELLYITLSIEVIQYSIHTRI